MTSSPMEGFIHTVEKYFQRELAAIPPSDHFTIINDPRTGKQKQSPNPRYYTNPALFCFVSTQLPRISLFKYIERIVQYSYCSPECVVLALHYLRMLSSSAQLPITMYTIHRLFLTAIVVAAKYRDDKYFTMVYYAQVGGVPVSHLIQLEVALLEGINFNCHVEPDTYLQAFNDLVSLDIQSTTNAYTTHSSTTISSPGFCRPEYSSFSVNSDAGTGHGIGCMSDSERDEAAVHRNRMITSPGQHRQSYQQQQQQHANPFDMPGSCCTFIEMPAWVTVFPSVEKVRVEEFQDALSGRLSRTSSDAKSTDNNSRQVGSSQRRIHDATTSNNKSMMPSYSSESPTGYFKIASSRDGSPMWSKRTSVDSIVPIQCSSVNA